MPQALCGCSILIGTFVSDERRGGLFPPKTFLARPPSRQWHTQAPGSAVHMTIHQMLKNK